MRRILPVHDDVRLPVNAKVHRSSRRIVTSRTASPADTTSISNQGETTMKLPKEVDDLVERAIRAERVAQGEKPLETVVRLLKLAKDDPDSTEDERQLARKLLDQMGELDEGSKAILRGMRLGGGTAEYIARQRRVFGN